MRKSIILLVALALVFCGCESKSIGVIGGADGPTAILVTDGNEDISSVRMIFTEGNFYYDTGAPVKYTASGVIERVLEKTADPFGVPQGEGSANFDGKNMMFQPCTPITKQVYVNGAGTVYRKVESYGENLGKYKFCYRVTGRHPNAAKDSQYLVMANEPGINFERITKYFFSSQLEDHMLDAHIIPIDISDEWGITMYVKNETPEGCTLAFEQLGGKAEGSLQTGSWYKLEKYEDGKWVDAKTVLPMEQVGWDALAYLIRENDITESEVNWKWLYGKLSPGTYRISKEIMDFKQTGNFEEKVYTTQFVVE